MVDSPTADNPREPDISHENPAAKDEWFGHPRQLARLFTTEAMERFGYYGMRALLTLYLAQHFLFSDTTTTGLYGGFTALVYLTPLIGGLLADRILGSKRSVKFGAILMSIGYLVLCFGGAPAKPFAIIDGQRYEVVQQGLGEKAKQFVVDHGEQLLIKGNDDKSVSLVAADGSEARKIAAGGFKSDGERNPLSVMLLLMGLGLVVIGNGFFKPNISTIVGSLYAEGDRRRGHCRLHRLPPDHGQDHVRDVPGVGSRGADLVVRQGQPPGIPDDGRGDGADHLQHRVLDLVRTGRLVADPVRGSQHRPQRVRGV